MAGKLKESTIDAVLDHLAENEGFRTRFRKNPRKATQSIVSDDPAVDTLPEDELPTLASAEDFRKSRDVVRKQLVEAMAPFVPISLDIPR